MHIEMTIDELIEQIVKCRFDEQNVKLILTAIDTDWNITEIIYRFAVEEYQKTDRALPEIKESDE